MDTAVSFRGLTTSKGTASRPIIPSIGLLEIVRLQLLHVSETGVTTSTNIQMLRVSIPLITNPSRKLINLKLKFHQSSKKEPNNR